MDRPQRSLYGVLQMFQPWGQPGRLAWQKEGIYGLVWMTLAQTVSLDRLGQGLQDNHAKALVSETQENQKIACLFWSLR